MGREGDRQTEIGLRYGEQIKAFRTVHKMSQWALAEAVGVTQASVERWENGYAIPRDEIRPKIAEALGVRTDVIFRLGA